MANSVDDALNRANDAKRDEALHTIEQAKSSIQYSTMQGAEISSNEAAAVAKNAQIIEEARRTIPAETMTHVDTISPPTPPMHGNVNSTVIELNPTFQSKIETIEQGEGNNYMRGNALDLALERPEQETAYEQPEQQQQKAMGR